MQILICGNYGANNLGDELILMGLLKMLKEIEGKIWHDPSHGSLKNLEITIISANPSQTENLHHIKSVKIFPTGLRSIFKNFINFKNARETIKTWKAIKNADLILFGGGELFNEGEKYSLYLWFAHVKIFQWLKKPYVIIGQSFSSFEKKITKKILENVAKNAEEIFVRDQDSQNILYLLNIAKSVEVTTDPAFALDENDFHSEAKADTSGATPGTPEARPEAQRTAHINKESPEIITVLRNYRDLKSEKISKKIESLNIPYLKLPFEEIFTKEKINKYFNVFLKAKIVISMRLHGIILAALTKTPFIALSYHPKVKNMAEKLGFGNFVLESGLDKNFNENRLQQKINEIQDKKEEKNPLKIQLQEALKKERNMITKQKIFLTKLLKKF